MTTQPRRPPIELRQWYSDPPMCNGNQPNMIDGFIYGSGSETDGTYVRICNIKSHVDTEEYYLVSTEDYQYRLWKMEERT